MHNPFISIIIPTYNRAHLIGETLDSVLVQTYTNWECIVVDDGSKDDTECVVMDYVKKDTRIQYHKRSNNYKQGGNGARNYGAELSNSKFLIFLDSDDFLIKTTLENRIQNILKQDLHFDILINNTATFKKKIGDNELLWNVFDNHDTNDVLLKKFLNNDMPWHTNGVTWVKDFFKKTGGWNEELKAWQDWELHIKALLLNPIIINFDSYPDNFYRIEGSNSIKDNNKTMEYYRSVKKAVCGILIAIKNNSSIQNKMIEESNKLAIRVLIKMPIVNKFHMDSLKNFTKIDSLCRLKKSQIIKCYFIEFVGKSTKLKLLLIKNPYLKQQEYIHVSRSFMKLTVNDIKS